MLNMGKRKPYPGNVVRHLIVQVLHVRIQHQKHDYDHQEDEEDDDREDNWDRVPPYPPTPVPRGGGILELSRGYDRTWTRGLCGDPGGGLDGRRLGGSGDNCVPNLGLVWHRVGIVT